MDSPNDEQLLSRHLDGDPTAFRALVERYHRELFQFVLRFARTKSAADDIVQDAFIQVHLSAASFDPQRRFKPWLFTIAANKARDHLRTRTRRREVPLDAQIGGEQDAGQRFLDLLADDEDQPVVRLETQEQDALVRETVDGMSPNLSEILILAYYHQFAYRDIAEMLGIPLGTVKSRLHAAVTQFGARYKALGKDREDAAP